MSQGPEELHIVGGDELYTKREIILQLLKEEGRSIPNVVLKNLNEIDKDRNNGHNPEDYDQA